MKCFEVMNRKEDVLQLVCRLPFWLLIWKEGNEWKLAMYFKFSIRKIYWCPIQEQEPLTLPVAILDDVTSVSRSGSGSTSSAKSMGNFMTWWLEGGWLWSASQNLVIFVWLSVLLSSSVHPCLSEFLFSSYATVSWSLCSEGYSITELSIIAGYNLVTSHLD